MVSFMMRNYMAIAMAIAFALAAPIAASAAGSSTGVLATFRPVQLIAQEVAGDRMQIELLVEPGAEVHEYNLRPSAVRRIYEADLVIMSGAGLEDALESGLRQARRTVDASEGVDLIKRRSGVIDPHIWLDPRAAYVMARNIAEALSLEDPAGASEYDQNADRLEDRLKELSAELAETLAPHKGMTVVTYHESFNYFCRAYGLRTFSLTGPSAENPLPERVRRAYDIVGTDKVRAVFVESGASGGPFMQKMREDLGVEVCELDTMSDDERDYFEAMRYNAREIARCLGRGQ